MRDGASQRIRKISSVKRLLFPVERRFRRARDAIVIIGDRHTDAVPVMTVLLARGKFHYLQPRHQQTPGWTESRLHALEQEQIPIFWITRERFVAALAR